MHRLTPDEARAIFSNRGRAVPNGLDVWLDVRDAAAFAAGHLPGAGHLPEAEWPERRSELPPRHADVIVIDDDAERAVDAARSLEALEFTRVAALGAPWQALGVAPDTGPAARLWRPNAFLEEVAGSLPAGRVLDLACGSGRDAVFLALNGHRVEGWDADEWSLAAADRLARRHGVALTTQQVDLEAPDATLPDSAFDVVVCFRFLQRPLFPAIERALAPGGALVMETYRKGQERFGRPRRARFLLRDGELRDAFPTLDIVRYEEPSPDGGPWTARLLARRPAASVAS